MDQLQSRIGKSRAITILCAPPGFGKRQVISTQWKRESEASVTRFFDRIDHLENARSAALAILDTEGPKFIFIGGIEAVDSEYLSLALDRLVRTGADRRVILAMDDPTSLDLGTLRTAGHVEWLGSEELALTDLELRNRLSKIASTEDRKRLGALAGHWPIAVDMLVDWALRSPQSLRDFSDQDILHVSGLFDFISAKVWSGLSDKGRTALNRAALLSNPTRSILKGAKGHDRILAILSIKLAGLIEQTSNMVLLHPALQIFVREHCMLDDPEGQLRIMLELAERSSLQGSLSDAARLAAAAGEPDRIVKIAEHHGALLIWVLCGLSDLQSLVENAGEQVVSDSPVLRMMRCIVDLKQGRIGRAEAELQRLSSDPTIADTMKTEVEIIRVTLLVYGCSLARRHDIELLTGLLAQQSIEPAWQSFLATLSCILNSQRGRFEAANSNLIEARREAERAGSRYNMMFLFLHEAGLHIAQGSLTSARSAIASARKMWRKEFADDIGVETVIAALSAKVEFDNGRLTSARNALRKSANRLPDGEAWFDIYFAAYEPMARMVMREQGLPAALQALEIEKAKLDARGLGRVGQLLNGLAVCLAGTARLRGDVDLDCVRISFEQPSELWSWQERETYTIASAFELERHGDVEDAIALLEEAIDKNDQGKLLHSQIRYLIALFLLFHRFGQRKKALDCLENIVSLVHETGMRLIAQDAIGEIVTKYALELEASSRLDDSMLKALKGIAKVQNSISLGSTSLTKREMDIMIALADGGSDKEIARHLQISDHGVRYHLKNIFRKLGVHDRLAAVLSAKRKKWI